MPDAATAAPSPLDTLKGTLPALAQAATAPNQNSNQRLAAMITIVALPFLNQLLGKFGASVSEAQLMAVIGALVVYIGQSVTNAIHARNVAAAQAAAPTPAGAVADLNRGVDPVKS